MMEEDTDVNHPCNGRLRRKEGEDAFVDDGLRGTAVGKYVDAHVFMCTAFFVSAHR